MKNGVSRTAVNLLTILSVLLLSGCLMDKPVQSEIDSTGGGGASQNAPPTIGGNPETVVMMGDSYSFTPSANDPDGDRLSFSLQNKPVWAEFDSDTGRLSGTPTLADVGIYESIELTVSDGEISTSMPVFSVDVTQVGTVSASLSWTAPIQNTDGTALADLAGFIIYYGKSSGNYTKNVRIDNPAISTYVVGNLTPGTYYFAATAFNSVGIESRYSMESVKVLN